MVQTERLNGKVLYPDGCGIKIRKKGSTGDYVDFGILEGDTTNSAEWTESRYQSGNAGILNTRIKDMKITGKTTIVTHEADILAAISAGIITRKTTAGAAITPTAQTIAAGWTEKTVYPLVMKNASGVAIKTGSAPVISDVALGTSTPETLTEGTDYVIVKCPNAKSGFGISFLTAGISAPSPTTYAITVTYVSNTPIARESLFAGSTSKVLEAFELMITQKDSAGNERGIELYNVTPKSGGFGFNFLGQGSDGVEKMELSYEANLDTSRTDGEQLYEYWIDEAFAA